MRRYFFLLIAILSLTGIGCPPAVKNDIAKTDDAKADGKKPKQIEVPVELKPRLEAALDHVRGRELLAKHGFWTVFHGILGTGLEKTMLTDPKTKKKINAIDFICQGGEIRGLEFVPTKDGLDVRIDPEWPTISQGHQDQFIAEMAQWGMPAGRKFRVAGTDYTFEHFVKHSKARASVKKDQELSWAIIIIAQYYGTGDEPWVNTHGETLKYSDIVRYEVNASIEEAACGGTHRLFGLTWAYHLHLKNGGKKEGVWRDVEKRIADYKDKAHQSQNKADGSLSTDYFKSNIHFGDKQVQISTTGHIVEWLALAMTDEELRYPWMQDAVNSLVMLILNTGDEAADGGALYHAAHGLHLYHERVFSTPAPYLPLPPKN
jgi:hypothetical protein